MNINQGIKCPDIGERFATSTKLSPGLFIPVLECVRIESRFFHSKVMTHSSDSSSGWPFFSALLYSFFSVSQATSEQFPLHLL